MGLCPGRFPLCGRACSMKAPHRTEKGLLTLHFVHPVTHFIRSKSPTEPRMLHLCCAPLDFAGERARARDATNYGEETGSATGHRREREGTLVLFPAPSPSCSQGLHRWVFEGQGRTEGKRQVAQQKAPALARLVLPTHFLLVAIPVWQHHRHRAEVLSGLFPLF